MAVAFQEDPNIYEVKAHLLTLRTFLGKQKYGVAELESWEMHTAIKQELSYLKEKNKGLSNNELLKAALKRTGDIDKRYRAELEETQKAQVAKQKQLAFEQEQTRKKEEYSKALSKQRE